MSDFAKMKGICIQKLEQARKLVDKLSVDLINRDLAALAGEMPQRLRKTGYGYMLDDKIELRIENSVLELEDRRGVAFNWGFEIWFTEFLYTGNILGNNGKRYRLEDLHEVSFDGVLSELQELNNKLDRTLEKLHSNKTLDEWSYNYYSAHEDITCETIRDVANMVVKRKP